MARAHTVCPKRNDQLNIGGRRNVRPQSQGNAFKGGLTAWQSAHGDLRSARSRCPIPSSEGDTTDSKCV